MFKTILVPLGGGEADRVVLDTALTLARPFGAYMDCFHSYLDGVEATASLPSVSFLVGPALHDALEHLDRRGHTRAVAALRRCIDFCKENDIDTSCTRQDGAVSAGMVQAHGRPAENLIFQARHHDLVVMARPGENDGLPADTLPQMLLKGGQPILLVPEYSSGHLLEHQMICWKDTAESARAVAAAMPLLKKASRVTVISVEEGKPAGRASLDALLRHLAHHEIQAGIATALAGNQPLMDALTQCALDHGADLLVMGGYSRGAARELWFGGCTQSALDRGGLPIFIAH